MNTTQNLRGKSVIKSLLWDVDINKINLKTNKRYIIERVLKYGMPEHVNWLLQTYTEQEIVEVVKKSRNIDKKTANYWAIHFSIPKTEVLCLKRPLMQKLFY